MSLLNYIIINIFFKSTVDRFDECKKNIKRIFKNNFGIVGMVRRKNVPGLIGKLRYKDDSLNFIFVRKYAHSKNISM